VSDPFGKTISYSHDGNSNLSGFTDQFAGTVSLSYDSMNRVSTLTDRNSNQTSYTYNDDGLTTRINLPNGAYTTHSYNNRDFTTQVAHRKSDDTLIDSFSYTYDSAGNPTALTENNGGSVSFSYDNVNQLSGETRTGNNTYAITYEYDAVGNRTRMVKDGNTTNYTYDNMNRMTAAGSTTFTYDANGDTISKTEGSDTTTYEYDYENRMTRIVYPGGGTTETSAYNGDGVRLSRTDSSGTTRFFWKQGPVSYAQGIGMDDLAFQADGSNQMTAAYHYAAGLVGMTRGSSNYWYHYDNLGATRLVTDSSQATAASYVYDAFGNIRSQTGSLTNPYEYVGKLGYFTDPGPSGLLFLRARYYAPGRGRFWTADPAVETSEYSYAKRSPLVEVDPSGLLLGCGEARRCDKRTCEPSALHVKGTGTGHPWKGRGRPEDWPKLGLICKKKRPWWDTGPMRVYCHFNLELHVHQSAPRPRMGHCIFEIQKKYTVRVGSRSVIGPDPEGYEGYETERDRFYPLCHTGRSRVWGDFPGVWGPPSAEFKVCWRIRVRDACRKGHPLVKELYYAVKFDIDAQGNLVKPNEPKLFEEFCP
jgi:RHS repeat-associated protein